MPCFNCEGTGRSACATRESAWRQTNSGNYSNATVGRVVPASGGPRARVSVCMCLVASLRRTAAASGPSQPALGMARSCISCFRRGRQPNPELSLRLGADSSWAPGMSSPSALLYESAMSVSAKVTSRRASLRRSAKNMSASWRVARYSASRCTGVRSSLLYRFIPIGIDGSVI